MTKTASRTLGALALGTLLAAMPVAGFHAGGLSAPLAFAKNGGDDKGGDDNGGGNGGGKGGGGSSGKSSSGGGGSSGSKGGSGSGSSGSKGSDDHGGGGSDDHGGRGGGSDDSGGDDHGGGGGDDHGGRGGGSDDSGGDDHGGGGGSDDRGGDDHGGRGGGSDDATRSSTLPRSSGLRVTRVERTATGVEVTYSNGVREEVENGRLEQKDASGRTVLERPATRRDLARLEANARNSGLALPAAVTGAPSVETRGGSIEVSYPTGWREELEGGRYELKDPDGNTVVERPATAADVGRLRALVGG